MKKKMFVNASVSFRKIVNDTYVKLYEEGQFSSRKTKANISCSTSSNLFSRLQAGKYCLYKATEYVQFVEGLGITPPSVVEERYALSLISRFLLKTMQKKKDILSGILVDVHNLMFMFSESEQTEEEREDLEDGSHFRVSTKRL